MPRIFVYGVSRWGWFQDADESAYFANGGTYDIRRRARDAHLILVIHGAPEVDVVS